FQARRAVLDRPIESFALTVMPSVPRAGEAAHFIVWPSAGDRPAGWGTLELDFGDGHAATGEKSVDNAEIRHIYESPGYYEATGHLVSGLRNLTANTVVVVAPRADDRAAAGEPPLRVEDLTGLPADVANAPQSLGLRRVTIAHDT